jgi:hypothetical protein
MRERDNNEGVFYGGTRKERVKAQFRAEEDMTPRRK